MYLKMATKDDKKMVKDWKADADGILIFVCFHLHHLILCFTPTQLSYIDWSILRCCLCVDLSFDWGYSTEPTRYFQLLPREHLSDAC